MFHIPVLWHFAAIPGKLQQFQGGVWAKIKSTEIEWNTFMFEEKTLRHIITNFHSHQSFIHCMVTILICCKITVTEVRE